MQYHLGLRVLLVEDNPLVATAIEDVLAEAGHSIVEPFRASAGAPPALPKQLDVALLDVSPLGGSSFEFAAELGRRGIPFAFVSTESKALLPAEYRDRPFLAKPFAAPQLLQTISTLAAAPSQLALPV
jgi:CheY-like chemotaxis protein